MSAATTAIAAGNLLMGAVGTVTSFNAQRQQGQVAQDAANANASILEARSQQATNEANARAAIQQRQNARVMGAQKAAFGASGVDVNSGTALDVAMDTATEGELQTSLIRYGGSVTAQTLAMQAANLRRGGAAAADAANTGAWSTLLTGGAKAAQAGYNLYSTLPKSPKYDSIDDLLNSGSVKY